MATAPETRSTRTVWSRLADGPLLAQADERARGANEYRPETIPPLVDDPASAEILPQLGYRLEATSYPGWATGPRRAHTWKRPHAVGSFLLQLHGRLHGEITSEGLEDGTVRQRLRTEDAVAVWHSFRSALFGTAPASPSVAIPEEEHLPAHLAFAMQQIPGSGWEITADGLERVLPPWPLRYAPALQPPKLELKTRLLVDCTGWAYLPANSPDNEGAVHELVYLSGVGPQKKLKAAWATLMDKKRDTIKVPLPGSYAGRFDLINTRRMEGSKIYETHWNDDPLPESGLAHLVIQHRSLLQPRTGQPFLHLVGADGTPHLTRFAWQLDQASTLPIKPAWADRLWHDGLAASIIITLPSYGCQAYWVRPDEAAWAELVARCAGATGPVSVESFGVEPERVPDVAMVIEEHDDVDDAPERTIPVPAYHQP